MGGRYYRPPPIDPSTLFTTGELMAGLAYAPPCQIGVHVTNMTVTACTHFYAAPPGPTLAPEEICDRGGIGPCHPGEAPPVVRLAHTQ